MHPVFAILSIIGFVAIFPVTLLLEPPKTALAAWSAALAKGYTTPQLMKLLSVSCAPHARPVTTDLPRPRLPPHPRKPVCSAP